jgi:hypothetical protein
VTERQALGEDLPHHHPQRVDVGCGGAPLPRAGQRMQLIMIRTEALAEIPLRFYSLHLRF